MEWQCIENAFSLYHADGYFGTKIRKQKPESVKNGPAHLCVPGL